MDSKLLFIFLFLISIKAEADSCFIGQQLDILQCFNQSKGSISVDRKCCEALNQLAQAGYSCLCSLITTHLPLLPTPFSIALSDCYISAFPSISCQGQMPAVLPPKEISQPSPPKPALTPTPETPQEAQAMHNLSLDANSPRFKEPEKNAPKLNLIYRGTQICGWSASGDKIREFPYKILSVLLPLALIFCSIVM